MSDVKPSRRAEILAQTARDAQTAPPRHILTNAEAFDAFKEASLRAWLEEPLPKGASVIHRTDWD